MWLKRVYHFFVSGLLGLILLVLIAFTFVHVYQDEIVELFIGQANKYINTPVKTDKVSVSLFTDFPNVAIAFENVWIKEGFEGSDRPLAIAGRVYCTFSVLDLLRKNYTIHEIHLEDAEVYLRVRPSGAVNYEVISRQESTESTGEALSFDLQGIRLHNVLVEYDDRKGNQLHRVQAYNAQARLTIEEPLYAIELAGKLRSHEINAGDQLYLKGQDLDIDTQFTYNTDLELLHIQSSKFLLGESSFMARGDIASASELELDLLIESPQTDFQTLVAILPADYTKDIRKYRSQGALKFTGSVKGTYTEEKMPAIAADFSAHKASFFLPDYSQALENISLTGSYTNGQDRVRRTSVLKIENLQAQLNNKPISGSILLRNFDDYHLSFNTKSVLDAASALRFYPLKNLSDASGQLDVSLDFSGRLKDLENPKTISKVKAGGEVIVKDLAFKLATTTYPMRKLNGSLIFNNNDLALSNLSGEAGNSSFVVNGLFKNIFSYLLLENQPIMIEADLQSDFIDLDELLADDEAAEPVQGDERFYAFDIRPDMTLYFNCKAGRLKFDRFSAKNIAGELTVRNGIASVKNGSLQAAGGRMTINGNIDARKPNLVDVSVQARFKDIYADSVFWIFNDFNQTFLTHRNIKGRVTTDVMTSMQFDKKLRFRYDKLIVNATPSIVDGQLTDFEPMQNLSRFVKEERLANISFSEITSNIQVRSQTIYLPETIIRSDISAVTIRGTHSFDQDIDYHVKVPVKSVLTGKRKEVPSAAAQANGSSGMHLLLRIVGTTDDYKIAYDGQAVKEKVAKDIRKEGKELKEVIKNKSARTQEAVELEDDEYFDW